MSPDLGSQRVIHHMLQPLGFFISRYSDLYLDGILRK